MINIFGINDKIRKMKRWWRETNHAVVIFDKEITYRKNTNTKDILKLLKEVENENEAIFQIIQDTKKTAYPQYSQQNEFTVWVKRWYHELVNCIYSKKSYDAYSITPEFKILHENYYWVDFPMAIEQSCSGTSLFVYRGISYMKPDFSQYIKIYFKEFELFVKNGLIYYLMYDNSKTPNSMLQHEVEIFVKNYLEEIKKTKTFYHFIKLLMNDIASEEDIASFLVCVENNPELISALFIFTSNDMKFKVLSVMQKQGIEINLEKEIKILTRMALEVQYDASRRGEMYSAIEDTLWEYIEAHIVDLSGDGQFAKIINAVQLDKSLGDKEISDLHRGKI